MSYKPPSLNHPNRFREAQQQKEKQSLDFNNSTSFPSLTKEVTPSTSTFTSANKWCNKLNIESEAKKSKDNVDLVMKPGWAHIHQGNVTYYSSQYENIISQLEKQTLRWNMCKYYFEDQAIKKEILDVYGDYRSLGQEQFDLERQREYQEPEWESDLTSEGSDNDSLLSDPDY